MTTLSPNPLDLTQIGPYHYLSSQFDRWVAVEVDGREYRGQVPGDGVRRERADNDARFGPRDRQGQRIEIADEVVKAVPGEPDDAPILPPSRSKRLQLAKEALKQAERDAAHLGLKGKRDNVPEPEPSVTEEEDQRDIDAALSRGEELPADETAEERRKRLARERQRRKRGK